MTALSVTSAPTPAVSAASEAVVRAVNLVKVFHDFWHRPKARAVDGISFEVHPGEVFGLLGPNGSGKSTTIKLMLGLLHPTSGKVAVFGRRPDDVATKKRIGYLPEESYLYRFLNARETLDYYGRLFHQDRRQRTQRTERLLEMVGLTAVQRRAVGEYSKGMQRRIGLAQALINDPDLLILDEPTTGMDPIGTRQIKDLILELSRRGKTIILCSHLLADVEDVCDRVAIMFGGKIRALDTVDALLTRQDRTVIHTDPLDPPTVQQVERVLEAHGRHIDRIEQPRISLESLFLEIVQQAQAEGATTSGAGMGGPIADFLAAPGSVPGSGSSSRGRSENIGGASKPVSLGPDSSAPAPETTAILADLLRPSPPPASGKSTAATPAASDAFEAPPSAEELQIINELGQNWAQEPEKASPSRSGVSGPDALRGGSAQSAAAQTGSGTPEASADEQPDSAFLDALTQVPEYESKDKHAPTGKTDDSSRSASGNASGNTSGDTSGGKV